MIKRFRKKPVIIEAVQFTYDNLEELSEFCKEFFTIDNPIKSGYVQKEEFKAPYAELVIPTLEGNMTAKLGDWIIKGVNGEFYPCKPDIFKKTYEEVI